MMPIEHLHPGQIAEVNDIVGPVEQVRRLAEIGLKRGARLELLRGGSPCIVRIDGAVFCYRDDASVRVLVAPRMSA